MEQIKLIRKLKNVFRMSRMPLLRQYNVLEHQYMVGILFKHFAMSEGIPYTGSVLDLVLKHDIVESVTGDLPYDVKNHSVETKHCWHAIESSISDNNPFLKNYTDHNIRILMKPEQHALFKACDLLELWLFLVEERQLGNSNREIQEVIDKCELLIGEMEYQFESIVEFIATYED